MLAWRSLRAGFSSSINLTWEVMIINLVQGKELRDGYPFSLPKAYPCWLPKPTRCMVLLPWAWDNNKNNISNNNNRHHGCDPQGAVSFLCTLRN